MSYPKRLIDFKAWAKAMEAGAVMDRPEYRGTANNSTSGTSSRRARRKRRTFPRRKRKREE